VANSPAHFDCLADESKPATFALPAVGASMVVSILMVVVLPAPFGPSRPKMEPAVTAMFNVFTAVSEPKRRVSPDVSTAVAGA